MSNKQQSSQAAGELRRQGLLIVVSAPSGAGKTSLLHAAIDADDQLGFSVSYTTRQPRSGEVDGEHYYFVTREEFKVRIEQGDFLEHAQVFGNLYGTSRSATQTALASGRDLILEIDWQGARNIREHKQDCISIFIVPPSLDELQRRLENRGEDSPEVIQRRMAEAQAELSHWQEYEYLIINDDFEQARQQMNTIIDAARLHRRQQEGRVRLLLEGL